MKRRSFVAARAALVVALAAAAFSAAAQTAASAAAPTAAASAPTTAPAPTAPSAAASAAGATAAPATVEDARALLAKAKNAADYAAMLDSFSSAMPPSDSFSLLRASLDSNDAFAPAANARLPYVVKAGDLAFLLGLFQDAAARYAEAASLTAADAGDSSSAAGSAFFLRSARCDLAAGDYEKALAVSSRLIISSADPDLAAASRLVGAWALALQGRAADARALALSVADGAAASAERRREASFIVWLCSEGADKDRAAARLAADFPASAEARISAGAISPPPLPHWYLGGLSASSALGEPAGAAPRQAQPSATGTGAPAAPGTAVPAPAGSGAPTAPGSRGAASPSTAAPGAAVASGTAATDPGAPAAGAARGKRLQVGFFTQEDNARALKDELASKGFSATIEPRPSAVGSGTSPVKRWIVAVDGGKDIAKTRQSLKDAGYESYVID